MSDRCKHGKTDFCPKCAEDDMFAQQERELAAKRRKGQQIQHSPQRLIAHPGDGKMRQRQ
jgi:hypothetical protein